MGGVEGPGRKGGEGGRENEAVLAGRVPRSGRSEGVYGLGGYVPLAEKRWVGGGAAAGGVIGAIFLKRVGVRLLKNIFTLLMLASGIRMLF